MPTNQELIERASRSLLANYQPAPFVMSRGKGCRLYDVEDNEYLDFGAGIAVVSVGHAHPRLCAAIADQAARLMHVSNLFYNDRAIELAAALTERTCFDRVYFANSGTEANEALLKLARRHHHERGDAARVEWVSTRHSFHGRTYGALSITGQPKYHVGMGPMVPGVVHVPFDDLRAMREAVGPRTAAVIVEPVQAEGGIVVPSEGYLEGLRRICDDAGALLFFDEVQTGVGRTGRFLAREHSGVVPDGCSLAKGIGGGFPLAAMAVTERLAGSLPPGSHASTFGGNALACAAGLAVLSIVDDEGLVDRAARLGDLLGARLAELAADPAVPAGGGARGLGLLRGLPLAAEVDPAATLALLRRRRLLVTLAGGTVLRITPPLVVTEAELDEGLGILGEVLRDAPRKQGAGS